MKYMIVADIDGAIHYWRPNESNQSLSEWYSDFEDGWRVPGFHYLQKQIQFHLPTSRNQIDGVEKQVQLDNIRILDVGIE